MNYFNRNLMYILMCLFALNANAQVVVKKDSIIKNQKLKFNFKQLIIPSILMSYGIIGLENDNLKLFNAIVKEEVNENIDEKITIDDFSQYAPAFAVYILNFTGIKSKNNFKNRTIILATSYLLVGSSVYGLKKITNIERPDGSSFNSFPSGHTATAFAGAEFLWQEYKDVSIWYGISGYLVASGTGIFRIYNDKHWLTDVVMGAGIGILSTKIAYWMFPYINSKIFKSKKNTSTTMIAPFYNGNQLGLGMMLNLN